MKFNINTNKLNLDLIHLPFHFPCSACSSNISTIRNFQISFAWIVASICFFATLPKIKIAIHLFLWRWLWLCVRWFCWFKLIAFFLCDPTFSNYMNSKMGKCYRLYFANEVWKGFKKGKRKYWWRQCLNQTLRLNFYAIFLF